MRKIFAFIYLFINITTTLITIIFLSIENFNLLNTKFNFCENILYFFTFNSCLGLFCFIKNRKEKHKINYWWLTPLYPLLFIGLAYGGYLLEALTIDSFDINIITQLILIIIIFIGLPFWIIEMFIFYKPKVLLKIYFSIIYPIGIVASLCSMLAISVI